MKHARQVALVWGSEPPVFSIGYEEEKLRPGVGSSLGFVMLTL